MNSLLQQSEGFYTFCFPVSFENIQYDEGCYLIQILIIFSAVYFYKQSYFKTQVHAYLQHRIFPLLGLKSINVFSGTAP